MGENETNKGGDNNTTTTTNEEIVKEKEEIIVLKVDMHCEACSKKVIKSLKTVQGVEDIAVDRKTSTIGVKGKIGNPLELCERIQSKTGRNALLISPLPKPKEESVKEPKDEEIKEKEKDNQPPPVVTIVLRVQMHCEACAHRLRKLIRKVKGIESVETNVGNSEVSVKGVIPEPEGLVKYICKKTRKQVSIIVKDKENQEKTNKEEEKKDNSPTTNTIVDEAAKDDDKIEVNNRYEYYWPSVARYNYMEHHNNYQPQFFSDENPNACFIM